MSAAEQWQVMRRLLDRVSAHFESDVLVDECLDALVEGLAADRGMVVFSEATGALQVVHARTGKRPMSPSEQAEISKTLVRQALSTGRCAVWNLAAPDLSAKSLMALGIPGALAAPLPARAGRMPRGVVYVDFRDYLRVADETQIELFASAVIVIGALLEQHALSQSARSDLTEARAHVTQSRRTPGLTELLGYTGLEELADDVRAAVHGDGPLLILGASGSGKTVLAQAIAEASGRRPIVRAVLGGSDDLNTITSELFGHERGAYSGATARRSGLVEFARGGTLILDELLNLPPHAQQLLLDFTQFGTYRPLGWAKPEPKVSQVRLICATNGDLGAAMRDGRFRSDLYYRLAGSVLNLPALRERRADIPRLAQAALDRLGAPALPLADDAREWLASPEHDWPGNVRQLQQVIAQAHDRALTQKATHLAAEHLRGRPGGLREEGPPPSAASDGGPLLARWAQLQEARATLDQSERALVRDALAKSGGVVAQAARELGVARTTLASKLAALGIDRK